MNSKSIALKRQEFKVGLRKEAIQAYKQQIRKQMIDYYDKEQNNEEHCYQKVRQLIKECQKNQFSINTVKIAIQYMCLADFKSVASQRNLEFVEKVLNTYKDWNRQQYQIISKKIYNLINRIVENHLYIQSKDNQNLRETILTKTFSPILRILQNNPDYMFQLWQNLSKCSNPTIARQASGFFYLTIQQYRQQPSQTMMNIIIDCFYNFQKVSVSFETLDFSLQLKYINVLTKILENTLLEDLQIRKIAQFVKWVIKKSINARVKTLVEDSTIFPQIFKYFEIANQLSVETIAELVRLVGCTFSSHQNVSYMLYTQEPLIINKIRNCIPIKDLKDNKDDNKNRQQNLGNLTLLSLFALSNIVATSEEFVGIYLKSDIFLCLMYLYDHTNNLNQKIQICYCFYNMICKAELAHLSIMVQLNIISQINDMIRCEISLEIKQLGLQMLQTLMLTVKNSSQQQILKFNFKFLENILLSGNLINYIEGLICCDQPKISSLSLKILRILENNQQV